MKKLLAVLLAMVLLLSLAACGDSKDDTKDDGKGDTQAAFNLFADLINRECASGWTYHSMETITVTESNGCANLFQAPIPTNYYMLIFERDI